MAAGPGKYDDICTMVREKTKASAALVIIVGGTKGQGFSCQAEGDVVLDLAQLLEDIAMQIRADLKKEAN